MKRYMIIASALALSCSGAPRYDLSKYGATTLYYGGDIVTVDDSIPSAGAVLVGDGRIVAVGGERELRRSITDATRLVDLEGRTMLPGFIDSHSHISQVTRFPDFSPAQGVVSSSSLIDYGRKEFGRWMERSLAEGSYREGDWFVGNGYDNTAFPDAVGPTAADLDSISNDVPICIIHTSNHVAVVNSKALEVLGYLPGSPMTRKYGALLGRYPDGRLNGLLEEEAYFRIYYDPNILMDNTKTNVPPDDRVLEDAVRLYASMGITTAQDGAGSAIAGSVREIAARGDSLAIDINSYGPREQMTGPSSEARYEDGLRRAGVKLFLDGSPQAKTAWLLQPYYVVPEGKGADYCGFRQMTDSALQAELRACIGSGYQVIAHANGSAAIGQFLEQYGLALAAVGPHDGLRPVLIHSQTITEDQLDRAKELGITPSFFHDHTYYWGDYYLSSILGPDLGQRISPLASALRRGFRVTIHQDSPVVPPDMIFSIHNAVNRTTRGGRPIGREYAVSPLEAIRMVTINGAWVYSQEEDRGSIAPGKIADFVILDRNPLKVAPDAIKEIKVVQTIKRDRPIFTAGQ